MPASVSIPPTTEGLLLNGHRKFLITSRSPAGFYRFNLLNGDAETPFCFPHRRSDECPRPAVPPAAGHCFGSAQARSPWSAHSLRSDLRPHHALGALGKPLEVLCNLKQEEATRRVFRLKRVQEHNLRFLAQTVRSCGL